MPSVGAFHETGSQGGRRPSHAVQPSQDNRAIIQQHQRYWDTRGTPHRERLVTVTYVCAALPFRWILRLFSSRRCRRCRRRFSAPVFLASALPCFSPGPHEKRSLPTTDRRAGKGEIRSTRFSLSSTEERARRPRAWKRSTGHASPTGHIPPHCFQLLLCATEYVGKNNGVYSGC